MKVYKATSTLNNYLDSVDFTDDHKEAEIILVGGMHIDLLKFPNLRGIFKCGVGTDNIPFKEAKEKNIAIELPSPKTQNIIFEETSNFACHLILSGLYSNISEWNNWHKFERNILSNKSLLVIGVGSIGKLVASKMSNFMEVTTYDNTTDHPDLLTTQITNADCISLHIPLTEENKGFFDGQKIETMKGGAILVNTARGPIVDEDALYKALQKKHIKAIFDVFWQEPYRGKLLEFSPNQFLVTPHVASTCIEFVESCAQDFSKFLNSLNQSNIQNNC